MMTVYYLTAAPSIRFEFASLAVLFALMNGLPCEWKAVQS